MRTEHGTGDVRPAQECYVVIEGVEDRPGQDEPGGPRVIRGRIKRIRRKHALAFVEEAPPDPDAAQARPSHAASLLATAYRMQEKIDCGEVDGPAQLAERFGVSRARVGQILGLAMLAPDIQEEILDPDSDYCWSRREMSAISRSADWAQQRSIHAGATATAIEGDAVSRVHGSRSPC